MAEITSNFELMIFFFYREKKRRETNVKDILQPDRFDYIAPKIKLYSLRASIRHEEIQTASGFKVNEQLRPLVRSYTLVFFLFAESLGTHDPALERL